MSKKPTKTKTKFTFARRARGGGGARLDLLLPRDWPLTEAMISWRWRSAGGETRTGEGTIDSLPSPGGAPVYVWTPASETLLTRAVLPTTSRAKVALALPYALEEQLLDDPAALHFAWRRENDGSLSVAVTAKEHVRNWLAALTRAGLKPTALCPATLLVPWSADCWSAAFVGDELLVRTGPTDGFTAPTAINELPALLAAAVKEKRDTARPPDYLILFQPPAGFSTDAWSNVLGVTLRVEAASFWDVAGDSEPALNLLQGEFAAKGEMGKQLRPWLPAAIMLTLWLIGSVAFDVVDWWQLQRQYDANTREMTALLMSAFPETKTVLDPYQQMQRNMETLQARGGTRANDMLVLLSRAATISQAEPRARIRGVQYSERNLTLDVTLPDGAALERVRQALQSSGVQADVISNTARDKEIDGRLRLRAATATPGGKS